MALFPILLELYSMDKEEFLRIFLVGPLCKKDIEVAFFEKFTSVQSSLAINETEIFMTKRMLIDANHPEETRVVIVDNSKLEEFDFESAQKLPLKGNIYLAKVVRVEPSLQAAFVDYGGGRHGFLAFNEIHPDYFRIPVSDREKLEELERAANPTLSEEEKEVPVTGEGVSHVPSSEEAKDFLRVIDTSEDSQNFEESFTSDSPGSLEGEDIEMDSARQMQSSRIFHKKYKIQEVIKSRQILLIQVVKEERGTKGAALTTYISLAGRYCVLMPNALKGGGISRKITDSRSRKRLRSLLEDLELPSTMGVIVRTAGMERTKLEIKRDLDYLLKLWSDIRELTLKSSAPSLIYREGDLIKRTLRDFYSKDIEEIIVEGEEAYRNAKDFMRLLMPSHAKRVRLYKDENSPLFRSFKVEDQIDAMHDSVVQLKSGGYIVINHTEALTAIDVNSGKANRERHIDETALRTNLEAAEETARQIRLRDLAGLIVIDFIDMSDPRHNAAVERKLRDSMRDDRARTQLGRISPFGLLELSRQRLRPNFVEASSIPCSHCRGTGMIRSTESVALQVLRTLEDGLKLPSATQATETVILTIHASKPVVSYLLNQKRGHLSDLEKRYSLQIIILEDALLLSPDFRIVSPFHIPLEEEKSSDFHRKENRKRDQKSENISQITSFEGVEKEASENSSRHPSKKRNRRNKHKTRTENIDFSPSGDSFGKPLERQPQPASNQQQPEMPAKTSENSFSKEKFSRKDHYRPRKHLHKSLKNNASESSLIEENFVVISDSTSEDKIQIEASPIIPQDSSSFNEKPSHQGDGKPFRRKTRYPLNTRHRSFKEKKHMSPQSASEDISEEKAPPLPPSPPQNTGEVRKGWWQRLLD